MNITTHARQRLEERFGVKNEADILKILGKLERDFIRYKALPDGKIWKTVRWKTAYLKGVIEGDTLITVIRTGWTAYHFLNKSNPALRKNHGKRNKHA